MIPATPGVLPASPATTPISRLSPSQYAVLTQCALRASWAAARQPVLLPISPAARLGSVIHALLHEAGRGTLGIDDATTVGAAWDRLVEDVEARMGLSWLERSLVPLRASVRDYEVRRIRAERKAAALVSEAAPRHGTRGIAGAWSRTNVPTSFETWVVSHDGSVGGYIDRVRDTPAGAVLVDYKSGVITEKAGAETIVKERYQIQLKLYAALYAETFGQWPAGLEIVPIEGAARAIPFTPDECLALLNEANKTLVRVNEAIARAARVASRMHRDELLANPDPVTCSSCSYRPVCRAYQRACTQGDDGWPVDVRGQVVSIQPLFNGRIGLTVAGDGGATMRVRSLCRSDIRHPALSLLKTGDHIAAYNLDGRQGPHIFSETPLTILYRCPNGDTP